MTSNVIRNRTLTIEKHRTHSKPGVNPVVLEGEGTHTLLVETFVLRLLQISEVFLISVFVLILWSINVFISFLMLSQFALLYFVAFCFDFCADDHFSFIVCWELGCIIIDGIAMNGQQNPIRFLDVVGVCRRFCNF